MAEIVAGVGISHAPGHLGWKDHPPEEVVRSVDQASEDLGRYIEDAEPDVIIAFLDDHFENLFRNNMPTIAMAIADEHTGPADQWLDALKLTKKTSFSGAPEVAETLFRSLVGQGFDLSRLGEIEYGNNLVLPWEVMGITKPIAVIPVFLNVFTRPLMSYERALAFGKAMRTAVQRDLDPNLRVGFLATGGLSHWPPFWNESSPADDEFLQKRMKRFQTEGPSYLKSDPGIYTDLAEYEIRMVQDPSMNIPLVNADWDREFLVALSAGDENYISQLTFEGVEEGGGHGAHEILNWIALMGAMGSRPANVLAYEAVSEWICGMAYVNYPEPELEGSI